jgi:hypothetical protein
MRKAFIIAGVVLGVVAISLGTFFVIDHFHKKELEQLGSQIATLNATLDAIGEIVTCYTVQTATFPGQEFTEALIIEQSIPASLRNDTFASEKDIIGVYSKIAITPGTPITKDMVMSEKITDSLRDIDISANRWPIGIQVGDYIDLRLTYPRGEDFIVLSHKRVMSIVDQTLKVYLTEEEQVIYQAALVDFYLSRTYGSDIYMTKYVEPGLQASAVVYYSIPPNVATVVRQDPNIINMAQVAVAGQLRETIEAARRDFEEGDDSGGHISGGRDELNSKVNSDYSISEVERELEEREKQEQEEDGGDSLITDVTSGVN